MRRADLRTNTIYLINSHSDWESNSWGDKFIIVPDTSAGSGYKGSNRREVVAMRVQVVRSADGVGLTYTERWEEDVPLQHIRGEAVPLLDQRAVREAKRTAQDNRRRRAFIAFAKASGLPGVCGDRKYTPNTYNLSAEQAELLAAAIRHAKDMGAWPFTAEL